jgi:enoyl-CoA hydratase
MGPYRHLRVEDEAGIALVRIERPPANAMDLELLQESHALLGELRSAEPAAVVLTGREEFFSAGVDLKVAPTLGPQDQRAMVDGINRMFAGWYGFPRPVVCAVNGHAIAGGLILALCGDRRIGARRGKLGLTELRAGIPYPAVAMTVVQAELSPQAARRLVLEADLVGPDEALELGALDELRGAPEVLSRSLKVAAELASLPRATYSRVKQQLRGPAVAAMERVIRSGSDPMLSGWVSDESGQASAAVLDRDRGAADRFMDA